MSEENKTNNGQSKSKIITYNKEEDSGLWYYLCRMPLIIPFVIPIKMYKKK